MKIQKPFYVAADRVTRPGDTWAKATLSEAIEHGKQILAQEPHRDYVAIVQVVKIVRRQSAPLLVEDVEVRPRKRVTFRKK